jgi:hypothetical protein
MVIKGLFAAIGAAVVVAGIILVSAVIGGTIVWLLWPLAIPHVFPKLVGDGWLAAALTWKRSVALAWICGALIKATQTNNSRPPKGGA